MRELSWNEAQEFIKVAASRRESAAGSIAEQVPPRRTISSTPSDLGNADVCASLGTHVDQKGLRRVSVSLVIDVPERFHVQHIASRRRVQAQLLGQFRLCRNKAP